MVRNLTERKGKYGIAKYRAFTSFEYRDWVTSRELILLVGLPYHSISKLLSRWVVWEYVKRQYTYKFGVGTYEYQLTARGCGWLEAARRDLQAASKFDADQRAWHEYIKSEIPELMAGKFKDVLAVIKNGKKS